MFATSSRSRRHAQPTSALGIVQESVTPPSPGSDSCFGVRSLNGSVEWVGEGGSAVEAGDAQPETPEGVASDHQADIMEAMKDEGGGEADTLGSQPSAVEASEIPPVPADISAPQSPSEAQRTIRQSTLLAPIRAPSPALFLPILSTSAAPSCTDSPPADVDSPPAVSDYSADTDTDDDDLPDAHSAPPTPTSQASLPSYLASEMSMSMPSSPGLGYSTDTGSGEEGLGGRGGGVGAVLAALERERARSGVVAGKRREGEEAPDLVIPMLSLPSSSLHLSLRPFEGTVEGLKVALVGDMGDTKAFLRGLEEKEELVQIGRQSGGGVGVIRSGKVEVVLITGLSVAQVRQKTIAAYAALHGLLNPAAAKGDQSKLREMVARYADREDWVHACLSVGDDESGIDVTSLEGLVHIIPRQAPTPSTNQDTSPPAQTSPMVHMDDPTPLARVESSSYFTHPISRAASTSPIPETGLPTIISPSLPIIQSLQCALDSSTIREKSIDNFLAWRPAALDSSQSSLDTQPSVGTVASGTAGLEVQPMPTLAKAQGGGEWEAGLSRRVAKRREGEIGASVPTAEREGRRRRSKGSTARPSVVAPLFPPSAAPVRRAKSHEVISDPGPGLGARNLLEKTFSPLRAGLKGWKRVLVVAAIVGVVGWGWWVSGRQTFA